MRINNTDIKDIMNCTQKAYEAVLCKYGMLPNIMLMSSWGFGYEEQEIVWKGINTYFFVPSNEFMDKLGFRQELILAEQNRMDSIMTRVKAFLREGTDIIVLMDAFYCPWNKAYRKSHIEHMCNIISLSQDGINCSDSPALQQKIHTISYKDFGQACMVLYSLAYQKSVAVLTEADLYYELIRNYSQIRGEVYSNYKSLANRIKEVKRMDELFNSTNPQICNIIIYFNIFSEIRHGISRFLAEYANLYKSNRIYDISCEFKSYGEKWELVKSIMLKMAIMGQVKESNNNKIAAILLQLGTEEEYCYNRLKGYLG